MTAIKYRYEDVGGLKVFYREAGHADASALLLLHGFPSASHTFRDLIPLLADRFPRTLICRRSGDPTCVQLS
jgi:pimeloyl-ACP methyl ester carboxylesterase